MYLTEKNKYISVAFIISVSDFISIYMILMFMQEKSTLVVSYPGLISVLHVIHHMFCLNSRLVLKQKCRINPEIWLFLSKMRFFFKLQKKKGGGDGIVYKAKNFEFCILLITGQLALKFLLTIKTYIDALQKVRKADIIRNTPFFTQTFRC